jgi:hypothetical protein
MWVPHPERDVGAKGGRHTPFTSNAWREQPGVVSKGHGFSEPVLRLPKDATRDRREALHLTAVAPGSPRTEPGAEGSSSVVEDLSAGGAEASIHSLVTASAFMRTDHF